MMALQTRENTFEKAMRFKGKGPKAYKAFKPFLRRDFKCTCAYCLVWESQFGGYNNFSVEHILPQNKFKRCSLNPLNLLYSCMDCNRTKKDDVVPKVLRKQGIQYLDPCISDYSDHFELIDGVLKPKSKSADYMIDKIDLNRPVAVTYRKRQYEIEHRANLLEKHKHILKYLEDKNSGEDTISAVIDELKEKIADNTEFLNLHGPKCLDNDNGLFNPE